MKKCLILLLFALFFLLPYPVSAQNKAGVNIGDHFNDFDKAADVVGQGGWVVVMACPGDADKIAKMIGNHQEVNIIIRGHYPGGSPNEKLAKLWAAALKSIPTPNKIYFMPWNEPNQSGSADWADPSQLVAYTNTLISEFSQIKGRVVLLSPMLNHTWVGGSGDFDNYVSRVRAIKNDYFNQFDGIAMNLYDIADSCGGRPLCSDNPHYNPLFAPQLLEKMGVSGKRVFGVESGTAGNNFYWKMPPDSSSPLYTFTQRFLAESNAAMFAIPAYDLAGEAGHSWSIFDPPDVINILKSAPDGGTTPAGGPVATNLTKCPGKFFSYYINDESECTECGSMINVCKPIKETDQFGEEVSKQSINIPQEAKYRKGQDTCITANFSGQMSLSNFQIPFANNLNKYFLGPYADNLKARVEKKEKDPFKDTGVLEKLAPKEYQDSLKLKFISEVNNRGIKSRYDNYRIEGRDLSSIANTFNGIRQKQKNNTKLTKTEEEFLNKVWPQVPLIANEESEGEVVFYASGIDAEKNKIKTAVPEVYRLNRATEILALMLGAKKDNVKQASTQNPSVLPANTCEETKNVPKEENNKKSKSGPGDNICTKPEIQEKENNFEGSRTFINDAGESCSEDAGRCDWDSENDPYGSSVRNHCCGNKGKCVDITDYYGDTVGFECQYQDDEECPGGCWSGGMTHPNCCVPENREKTRQFTDTDLNSKNRVPYLNLIIENTVGKSGLFNIFIPYLSDQYPAGDIKNAFEEVAGESTANLNIEIKQKSVSPGVKFSISNVQSQLTLLFHKLGTLVNVKNFVSGKLLWPHGDGTSPLNPGDIPQNMKEFFGQVGSSTGVPAKIIEAVMQIEFPSFFSLPVEKLNRYLADELIEGCGPNECSATGPMQMTTGVDNSGSSSCSKCCYPTCLSSCPNAWANYGAGGNPCVLKDNVGAAARKLKSDSGASSEPWTKEQVFQAARSYYGECTSTFARLGNRSYCQYVWDYYQGQ